MKPWGPLLFGIGFLAPLIATLTTLVGVSPPFGLSTIQTGVVIGTSWGLYAKVRGSWL
jgi:hypothetical protein